MCYGKIKLHNIGVDFLDIQFNSNDVNELNGIPNLSLAYLGDAVYELLVRAYLVKEKRCSAKELHNEALKFVSAPNQAAAIKKLLSRLSDEEMRIFRRGRNAKVNSIPHSATVEEYHSATGLETLFGYLYLKGRTERVNELFDLIVKEQ